MNVATVPVPLRATVPATGLPPAATLIEVVPSTTARSKPAETVVPRATPVAPDAGVRVVTDGGVVVVVNVHVTGTIAPPVGLLAPETVTVYVVPRLSEENGVNVSVFVDELYELEPETELPDGVLTETTAPLTAWSNPAMTLVFVRTATAPGAGVWVMSVGAAAVVKVHVSGAMIPPLLDDRAPDTVTV